jgi:transitional endoplasmic reticulum ATPase
LDTVCPPRGVYLDCISQEFTAQLLQEIDGLLSDSQAIFLVGATNRPDQVDSAILSRFTEQIEIQLPDSSTRAALLRLFLAPLRLDGDRTRLIQSLALATAGKSGRDLRHLVSTAVLGDVKRIASPQDFSLCESDFVLS